MTGDVVAAERPRAASSRRSRSSRPATWTPACWRCSAATAASWAPGMTTQRAAVQAPRARQRATCAQRLATLDGRSWRRRHGARSPTWTCRARSRPTTSACRRRPASELHAILARHGQAQRRRTSSTAAPAATTPAASTPWPSTRAWPRARCACPTPSSSCGATVDELAVSNRELASAQEALMHSREAGQHGPARRRHRPRGEQPAGRGADVRPPAAGGGGHRLAAARGPGDDRRSRPTAARRSSPGCSTSPGRTRSCAQPTDVARLVARTPARRAAARRASTVRVEHEDRRPGRRARPRPDRPGADQPGDATPCAAMPDGGAPDLRTDGDGDRSRFAVSDTGVGHPAGEPRADLRAVLHHQADRARARAWAWPSPTASSRCTAATSSVRVERRPGRGAHRHDLHRDPAAARTKGDAHRTTRHEETA